MRTVHFSINALNFYCIFPYNKQPLLLASLKPTRLLFLNPKQWNISNPYIIYVGYVFLTKCNTCKLVPTPEICLQIYGTPNNVRTNSGPDTTNVNVNKKSAYITHSHFFQECKTDLRFPLNNVRSTLWSLCICSTIAQSTKLTTTNPKHA